MEVKTSNITKDDLVCVLANRIANGVGSEDVDEIAGFLIEEGMVTPETLWGDSIDSKVIEVKRKRGRPRAGG